MSKSTPVPCEKCGKRLIDRLPNGLWHFRFGKSEEAGKQPPVDMIIHGSIQMPCLRKSCRHINTLTFLPPAVPNQPHSADSQVGNPVRENKDIPKEE